MTSPDLDALVGRLQLASVSIGEYSTQHIAAAITALRGKIIHCERCGGDWADTGLNSGCMCAERDALRAELSTIKAQAEDATEYVLALENKRLHDEVEALAKENVRLMDEHAAERDQLRAENAALRKDAERYRHVKSKLRPEVADSYDAALDRDIAMEKKP